ncbi:uncharacterized protein SCHCODRAFT_02673580 [Schizophyllum commune H4-8]|nr:uncharacterized protein SCHCODRAFT_02673580 [Schizophyllum commune H4-8]KAI5885389.1 hypothetical protein SCHCODRAFT_02673580 [Schizophyllum commune H4-8]
MTSEDTQTSISPVTHRDGAISGKQKLREFTITVQDIVPPGVNLHDKSVKHCYIQSRPTYYLGYFMSTRGFYESMKKSGRAEATMTATLDKYLAYIKEKSGITWGHGLKREILAGEERWLIWLMRSGRKEDVYTAEPELVADFRRLLGACVDPGIIIYNHSKHFIC